MTRSYEDRQQPVTLSSGTVADLWSAIKSARDEAVHAELKAREQRIAMNTLLKQMKNSGMADHLPTIEEVRAAWNGKK